MFNVICIATSLFNKSFVEHVICSNVIRQHVIVQQIICSNVICSNVIVQRHYSTYHLCCNVICQHIICSNKHCSTHKQKPNHSEKLGTKIESPMQLGHIYQNSFWTISILEIVESICNSPKVKAFDLQGWHTGIIKSGFFKSFNVIPRSIQ